MSLSLLLTWCGELFSAWFWMVLGSIRRHAMSMTAGIMLCVRSESDPRCDLLFDNGPYVGSSHLFRKIYYSFIFRSRWLIKTNDLCLIFIVIATVCIVFHDTDLWTLSYFFIHPFDSAYFVSLSLPLYSRYCLLRSRMSAECAKP